MCELTGQEYKLGSGRKSQLESLSENGFHRFFDFEKVSHGKFKINEIFETTLDTIDKRREGNAKGVHRSYNLVKSNSCFDVTEENAILPGVYKIENDEYIYIGSTIRQLSIRFREHFDNVGGLNQKTHDILKNNGVFTCLESFDKSVKECEVRERELYYILYYRNNSSKTVINKFTPYIKSEHKRAGKYTNKAKIKFIKVKLPENYYDNIRSILYENGYIIENGTISML